MGYFVARLPRPYDYRAFIDAYVYSQRRDYVHPDFGKYYTSLLHALEKQFGIRLAHDPLSGRKLALWSLFHNTVSSLLQIRTPWSDYLEAGLIVSTLESSGEAGRTVMEQSARIDQSVAQSESAHRGMLHALFVAIFGPVDRVVTSEDLRRDGFDDSKEPDLADYDDYM